MKGYRVRRVWGWDGHGLPIENKVETELNIKRKKDIEEKIGVDRFIKECKQYVNKVSADWEWYVDHIGRWVDFKNAYKTWDRDYMESVMWVFRQMYDKGYVYKGLRVSLYCPHCGTPISNFEVAMDADNYKELVDPATTYKYKLEGEEGTYLLAWSTTPWSKISTSALAVNPKLDYVKAEQNGENYILAKSTLKILGESKSYKIIETFKGTKLVGKKFTPHYDYYKDKVKKGEKVFEIIPGDFVTADEGAGIVTMAAYGVEDLQAMQENNIHIEIHLDEEGNVREDVPLFGGMYYLKANKAVNADLEERGLVYDTKEYLHSVPLCWRCHTRLYYAAIDAWYVNVQKLKPLMRKTNEKVNWYPKHFKLGRFLKSMENAPDWNISRNRYWGSPVPVWECECGERFVPGSIKELELRSGKKITDLHKPVIDDVFVECAKCGKKAKRVPEVLDSWIEAGSASFAERHFPFANAQGKPEKIEEFFPPDFIAEYTGQIRAWFYVLHVIGSALYKSPAFRNVLVEGVILGTDGRKMSKNFRNYPDPKEMLKKYGGDALRLYLMGSPVMRGEDILISEEQYRHQVKGLLLILWNVYKFFTTYANLNKSNLKSKISKVESKNVLDRWIISLLNQLVKDVTEDLDSYDTVSAINHITKFVQELSTWYIRRSRDRASSEDFLQNLHFVLLNLCKLLAPIVPFISEEIFKSLTDLESVHLEMLPKADVKLIDTILMKQMEEVRLLVEKVHALRKARQIRLRQPLSMLESETTILLGEELTQLVADEVNVKKHLNKKGDIVQLLNLDVKLTPELKAEGEAREIIRAIQAERKRLGTALTAKINVYLPSWPMDWEGEIKKRALVVNLKKADQFRVEVE